MATRLCYERRLDRIARMSLPFLFLLSKIILYTHANGPIEGRYSFSLTTFHPSGTLPQLSHAAKAATLGPPIVALAVGPPNRSEILLASLQFLPSPLIQDDGTSRFVKITDSIVVAHSGINADGRVVIAAAQRLAVEHAYTFQEEIPLQVFLEEMALLFQEYTMKAGSRPFGCSVLVASLLDNDEGEGEGEGESRYTDTVREGVGMYRIDPSGAVMELESIVYLGRGNGDRILQRLEMEVLSDINININGLDEAERVLIKILTEEMGLVHGDIDAEKAISPATIVCTRFSKRRGCVTNRINLQ